MPAQQRIEAEWYKGTADAVFQNMDILRQYAPEYLLILAGDHIYKMDYGEMLAAHAASAADLTIACIEMPIADSKSFGVMSVDEYERVVAFDEKPDNPTSMPGDPSRILASMGIYIFNAKFLYEQLIRDADDPHSTHDFGHDLIPHLLSRYRVYAHRFSESCVGVQNGAPYWRDVGTVDAYWEANMELAKISPDLNLYDNKWPIWTYQEQLPPAKFVFDEHDRCGLAIDSMVSGGCIISGATVKRSVLFSGVRVNDYSVVTDSVILPQVEIGPRVKLHRVVVDKGCRIPEGMEIGFDRHKDEQRFYVTEHGVTLITPEMLGQYVHHVR